MSKRTNRINRSLIYLSIVIICIFSIIPILWSISTSLKTDTGVYALPPVWIPNPITLQNYVQILTDPKMLRYFLNTIIVATGSTAISLIVGILGAYGFSRYKFPGSKTLLLSILFTRILPRVSLIVPFFVTLKNLSLFNTRIGLILVYLMVVMPISVWLLKGFFDNVPYEIEEAAIVDGCSPIGVLLKVVLPISLPAIASVGMYAFILAWNEFLFALIMTNGNTLRPISVGLAFFIDEAGIHWGPLMAASVLMSIPATIVFTLFQKNLIKGLSDGAVKG